MVAGDEIETSPFLRQLTSSDVPTRKEALSTLTLYLQRSTTFSQVELLKLWKGLFYCLWMTANPKPQQRLAQDYSSLVTDTVQKHNVLPFVDAFWKTMAMQWSSIDSQRMDKYLRLMRLMLRATLQFLGKHGFSADELDASNKIMTETPLNVDNARIANGIRFHTLDIFVDEIEVNKTHFGDNMSAAAIRALLSPITVIEKVTAEKSVRRKATEALRDPRLSEWGVQTKSTLEATTHDEVSDDGFEGFGD